MIQCHLVHLQCAVIASKTFSSSQKESRYSPFPPLQFLETTGMLSVSMDLPILVISYMGSYNMRFLCVCLLSLKHSIFEVHPGWSMCQYFIPSHGSIILPCVCMSPIFLSIHYPLKDIWASTFWIRCCCEHVCTYVCFSTCFQLFWIYI